MSRREQGRTYSEQELAQYLRQASDYCDRKLAEQRDNCERRIAGLEKHYRREVTRIHNRHQRVLDRLLRDLISMTAQLDELRKSKP